MQCVVAALLKAEDNRLRVPRTDQVIPHRIPPLRKDDLSGTKCGCSRTVIETDQVLFIKIHNFIRKIRLPLQCKSLPPPTLKSLCAGVTGTTAAGSAGEWVSAGVLCKQRLLTTRTPGTPKPRHSRNDTAPATC